MIDTATIKTLERLWDEIDAELFNPQFNTECRDALNKVLTYVKTMGEIEAAAAQIIIVSGDLPDGGTEAHDIFNVGPGWLYNDHHFASLADAWGRIKEQK